MGHGFRPAGISHHFRPIGSRALAGLPAGELTGFSRDYAAGVEWTGQGSVAYYRACEKAFDLEEDALLQWTFLAKAEAFAHRYGVSIERFAAGLQKALLGFRLDEGAAPSPQDTPELRSEEKAPRKKEAGKSVRNIRRRRSLMSTNGGSFGTPLSLFPLAW